MESIIKVKDIFYNYINSCDKILDNVNLEINKGECVILCGKSGSGKTTLSRLFNGLIPNFFEGDLVGDSTVAGLMSGQSEIENYVSHVGSVFQNPKTQYFNVNTTAELAFPCENSGYEPEIIVQRILEVSQEFGIEHLLDRNIFRLSGGEKQRIAFAAACMLNPQILVLDEPTSNLDSSAIEDLKNLIIKEKDAGTTIIIAEHRLAWTVDFADKYIYFDSGKAVNVWSNSEFRSLTNKTLNNLGMRVSDLTDVQKAVTKKCMDNKQQRNPLLKINNLSVGYNKKKSVYHIADFSIQKGEIIGIMGHNGIGKSTFGKTLCGLLKPISGQIIWAERPLKAKQLLKKSFLVMQDVNYQLFSDSVREEVLIGVDDDSQCDYVLQSLGLAEYADRHPMSLSGGQKQRVAIASAILSGKELIILDEPTSGLDRYHMEQVGILLQNLKHQDKAIIVITHDEELVAGWCDRVKYLK
ncbi:ABC transporter ATP-binding protein [Anaerosporobacter sp.]